jgi:8-oxo-dGTP pyrophosphatase MutT (NUDIX family)
VFGFRFRILEKVLQAQQLRSIFLEREASPPTLEDAAELSDEFRPAAVLVPLVAREPELSVLLTRRTEHLHHHPGQISFPGGRVEETDVSPVMTALRETEEEIGLDPDRVELLGELPEYFTGTGFRVTPVVGLVHPPFELDLDSFEVAEAFEVPLAFLLDPANHKRHSLHYRGRMREYWAMPYRDYYIWGATAGMLVSLQRMLVGK